MKLLSTLCMVLYVQFIHAQPLSIGQFTGVNQIGKIKVTGTQVFFSNINGAPRDQRIYAPLSTALPDAFTVSFNFTATYAGPFGSSLIPLAFTTGIQAVSNPDNQPTVQTAQDALGVLFETPKNNDTDLMLRPYIKNGTTVQNIVEFIAIKRNVNYRVILQRCTPNSAALSIFQGEALIKQMAFTINTPLQPLLVAQASNLVQAWERRLCSAITNDYKIVTGTVLPCVTINTLCQEAIPAMQTIPSAPKQEQPQPIAEKKGLLEKVGNVIKVIDKQIDEPRPVEKPKQPAPPMERPKQVTPPIEKPKVPVKQEVKPREASTVAPKKVEGIKE